MRRIGFLGAGKMAQALAGALIRGGAAEAGEIWCSDPAAQTLQTAASDLGLRIARDNQEVLQRCDLVFLAFKPQNFPGALEGLAGMVEPRHLFISILAGVRIAKLREKLPGKIVRVMPNTCCLVAEMAAGFTPGAGVTVQELEEVKTLLGCAGVAVQVAEEQLDAVTGLSGSGPAFVAYLIEHFIKAGVAAGLPAEVARTLALQTFIGTGRLLAQGNMPPEELIKMVSSPNGTTVAGRGVLESSDVGSIIEKTILRAAERSRELGR